METSDESQIVFVCHDQNSVNECLAKHKNSMIFLVGQKEINNTDLSRIIIARDLPDNIESKPKLLTFTVWYAIIKNDLFTDKKHICIVEHDVYNLPKQIFHENGVDVISFIPAEQRFFYCNISRFMFNKFLTHKKVNYVNNENWFSTSNHSMKREIIREFVDWYFPDCVTVIEPRDPRNFSFYHERLFWTFLKLRNYTSSFIRGVVHKERRSHRK